jgi:NTE family protein
MFEGKKIGLALGGGGAKGFAHIGVLKALEENKIPIDMISGTSIGAVVGALYCLGKTPEEIKEIAKNTSWKKLRDWSIPRKGLIKGDKIENYLREIFDKKSFADLKIPLFVTSLDSSEFREVIFNKGDLAKAARASVSIPGIFVPVENNGNILVDAGILDNIPVELLKKEGADIIIAVSLYEQKERKTIYDEAVVGSDKSKIPGIFTTLLNNYTVIESERLSILKEKKAADIFITPRLKELKEYEFDKVDFGIKMGEEAAKEQIDLLSKSATGESLLKKLFKVFDPIKEALEPITSTLLPSK